MTDTGSKKRVQIDEGGVLTITNDNAKWVHGDISTNIEGDYVISADDLRRLMVMMTENPMMICHTHTIWYNKDYMPKVMCELITTDKDIAEEVEKMNMAYKKANDELESFKHVKLKYKNLTRMIEKFNDSRHWWERKIDISSEEIE